MKPFSEYFKASEDIEYDPEELKMGIDIEGEHTTNNELAEIIAKHHLAEDPKYYTKLKSLGL